MASATANAMEAPSAAPAVPSSSSKQDERGGAAPTGKPGVGLPFLRVLTNKMWNYGKIEKRWQVNDRVSLMAGGDYLFQEKTFIPRAELAYKICDRLGSVVLTESSALIRKDFALKVSAMSMKVRCDVGCSLRGKPLAPKIDIDDPKPMKLFLGMAAALVALQKPLSASKVVPVIQAPIPFSKGKQKATAGLGMKLELQIRERALCLSVHELGGVLEM